MHIDLGSFRFRFKTEKEMIVDFGENWRDTICLGWCGYMDWFIGRIIPKSCHLNCFKTYIGVQDYFIMTRNGEPWCIGRHMIKLIEYDNK